jgi:hypothetical protein
MGMPSQKASRCDLHLEHQTGDPPKQSHPFRRPAHFALDCRLLPVTRLGRAESHYPYYKLRERERGQTAPSMETLRSGKRRLGSRAGYTHWKPTNVSRRGLGWQTARARPYYMTARVRGTVHSVPEMQGDRVHCPFSGGFEFGLAEEFQEGLGGGVEAFLFAVDDAERAEELG